MYEIRWATPAARFIRELDKGSPDRRRILDHVATLAKNPTIQHNGLSALKGEFEGTLRLRVGDFRVFLAFDHKESRLLIKAIDYRRDAYR